MKNIQLKIWPELEGYIPALVPIRKGINGQENDLTIDLSNVGSISSTGLNFTLLNLLKISKDLPGRKWNLIEPQNELINNAIENLGFYSILDQYVDSKTLFSVKKDFKKSNSTNHERNSLSTSVRKGG